MLQTVIVGDRFLTYVAFSLSVRRLHLTFEPFAFGPNGCLPFDHLANGIRPLLTWHQRTNQKPFWLNYFLGKYFSHQSSILHHRDNIKTQKVKREKHFVSNSKTPLQT